MYRANLASGAIRIKELFQKKFECFCMPFTQSKVLSLKTEFNTSNRCLTVCSNPFRPQWCPAGTRCCRTLEDTGLVGWMYFRESGGALLFIQAAFLQYSLQMCLIQCNYCGLSLWADSLTVRSENYL